MSVRQLALSRLNHLEYGHFAHAHAQNQEICLQAQLGWSRGRCSNTLVFFHDETSFMLNAEQSTWLNNNVTNGLSHKYMTFLPYGNCFGQEMAQ